MPDTLSNLLITFVPLALPLPRTGLNLATVPPSSKDPTTSILGCDKYPLPFLSTLTAVIFPLPINAVAVAPEPPPPDMTYLGAVVYPEPASAILIPVSSNPTLSNQCLLGYVLILERPLTELEIEALVIFYE